MHVGFEEGEWSYLEEDLSELLALEPRRQRALSHHDGVVTRVADSELVVVGVLDDLLHGVPSGW